MSVFVDVVDVERLLVAPGEVRLLPRVPADWAEWDFLFQRARDGINLLLGVADHLPGVDIPRLPPGSLADLVVKPFCGDWDAISQHAEASRQWGKGLAAVGANLAVVPLELGVQWRGATPQGFTQHHLGYARTLAEAGAVVATGGLAFTALGRMSLRVGERAIVLLTRLGRLLVRLASKIGKRLAPYVGWLATAVDVLADGVGPILDILHDLEEAIALVKVLQTLRREFDAFLHDIKVELAQLAELGDQLRRLPELAGRSFPGWPA
ncbi:MAG: hypothetical protein WAW88_00020 [Nocardioides sp.]